MKYYRRILEKTSGTGIIIKQDVLILLFPLLVNGDYVSVFRSIIRDIVESRRNDKAKLEQLSSVLILGIKYHLLDSAFIKSELIDSVYTEELSGIREIMENACNVMQTVRMRNTRYSIMTNSVRHDSHKSISCEDMALYLVYRLNSYLINIKHTEFLDAILDEGRNPGRYCNFTALSTYTNDISRFVSNCRDSLYFIGVIKVLVSMKNYHIIAAIIAGLSEVPKKYTQYVKNLSSIVMSPTYDVFVSRIGGKAKSTGSIPFLGTIITDIKHAMEHMYIDGVPSKTNTINRSQWNTLQYVHRLVQLFRNLPSNSTYESSPQIVDYSIDQYFNRVLNDLYIYSRKIYEWTVSDVCHFIRNVLITDSILHNIDSILDKIQQYNVDGKVLENMTIDHIVSMDLSPAVAKIIISRVQSYNDYVVYSYTDSVHDTCILLRNKGLERYCKVFAYHQILPVMIKYLTDEDLECIIADQRSELSSDIKEHNRQSEDIELIRSIL